MIGLLLGIYIAGLIFVAGVTDSDEDDGPIDFGLRLFVIWLWPVILCAMIVGALLFSPVWVAGLFRKEPSR